MALHHLFAAGYGGKVTVLAFDSESNDLTVVDSVSAGTAPSWVEQHPTKPVLYAADEFAESNGVIYSFDIEQGSSGNPSLRESGRLIITGEGPVHLTFSEAATTLFSSQYAGASVAALSLDENAQLVEETASVSLSGSGPHKDRQEAPHPHGVYLDPSGRYVLAPDLGTDKIRVFQADASLTHVGDLDVQPGQGPRHLAFSQREGKTLLYLIAELENTVSVYDLQTTAIEGHPLRLEPIQRAVSMLPPSAGDKAKDFTAAELVFTSDGRYLICSNRSPDEPGHGRTDHLAIFEVESTGQLKTPPRHYALDGMGPRDMALTKTRDGRELLAVTSQKTDELILLEWRDATLRELARAPVPQPTVVQWYRRA